MRGSLKLSNFFKQYKDKIAPLFADKIAPLFDDFRAAVWPRPRPDLGAHSFAGESQEAAYSGPRAGF